VAFYEPRVVLKTATDPDGSPNSGLVRLFALVLREYLESGGNDKSDLEQITAFATAFFNKVFEDLRKHAKMEPLLQQ
jgi:hypothetical protein